MGFGEITTHDGYIVLRVISPNNTGHTDYIKFEDIVDVMLKISFNDILDTYRREIIYIDLNTFFPNCEIKPGNLVKLKDLLQHYSQTKICYGIISRIVETYKKINPDNVINGCCGYGKYGIEIEQEILKFKPDFILTYIDKVKKHDKVKQQDLLKTEIKQNTLLILDNPNIFTGGEYDHMIIKLINNVEKIHNVHIMIISSYCDYLGRKEHFSDIDFRILCINSGYCRCENEKCPENVALYEMILTRPSFSEKSLTC